MKPLVSIIITNFNYANFLAEAIESALAQDYPNYEVIMIDDGSSDNSIEVACRYPITVLSQKNGGLCLARNNALMHAKGDYVLFLDADDRLAWRALSILVDAMESSADDVGYAYGKMQYFGMRTGVFESRGFDASQLFKSNYICATTLLRSRVLLEAGGYDNGFKALREDWELYVRLWSRGYRGVFVSDVVLECRKHKPHVRRSIGAKALSMAKLVYLYPGFFWKQWIRHPLRYTYYMVAGRVWASVRDYGEKSRLHGVCVVKECRKS